MNDSSHWIKIHLRALLAWMTKALTGKNVSETPVTGRRCVIDMPIFPSGFVQCCVFLLLVHDICSFGIMHMTRLWGCQYLGSVFFWPLNVTPEGLAQDAAWWLYFTVYWLSGSARAPHSGPVWTLWLAWKEGEREGLFLGCFCLKRRACRGKWHPLDALSVHCECLLPQQCSSD